MGTFRRSAIIINFGRAACGPGYESCEPSADEVRAKIERLLDSAWLTPHSIVALENFNGRSVETQGRKTYEMRVFVVLNYSGEKLQCRTSFCLELHNYLVNVDGAPKKVTVAGWLFFERAKQGWR
jgi:hypothetical protein